MNKTEDDFVPFESEALFRADDLPTPKRMAHYRLLRELGRGGMGVVYLAKDEKLQRMVALKILAPALLGFTKGQSRFHREVRVVAQLKHPSIIPIYEAGEADGIPFFTMEYVEGCTLADVIATLAKKTRDPSRLVADDIWKAVREFVCGETESKEQGESSAKGDRPYVEAVSEIISGLSDALSHAHASGVIHRDIKPSNILVTPDGRALLFDFGLARASDDKTVTRTGEFAGSPFYVSPEQIEASGIKIDRRTDIYSLGVTLYEMLTLRVPFRGKTPQQLFRNILVKEPDLPRKHNSRLPRDLETVCLTAMDKAPEHRYQTATEFRDDIERFLSFSPVKARPMGAMARGLRFVRRHRVAVSLATLAFLLVVGGPLSIAYVQVQARKEVEAAKKNETAQRLRAEASEKEAISAKNAEVKERRKAEAEKQEKEHALNQSRALTLVAKADALRTIDPELSLLLAIEAAELNPGVEANNAMMRALPMRGMASQFDCDRPIEEIHVAHDRRKLLAVTPQSVEVWDAQSGQKRSVISRFQRVEIGGTAENSKIDRVADVVGVSLDGNRVLLGYSTIESDKTRWLIQVLDASTGRILRAIPWQQVRSERTPQSQGKTIDSLAFEFSPDNRYLSLWAQGHLTCVSLETGRTRLTCEGVLASSFCESPRRFRIFLAEGEVQEFSLESGALIDSWSGLVPSLPPTPPSSSPSSSASASGRRLSRQIGGPTTPGPRFGRGMILREMPSEAKFSANGRSLEVDYSDSKCAIAHLPTKLSDSKVSFRSDALSLVTFSRNGDYIAGLKGKTIEVIAVGSGKILGEIVGCRGTPNSIRIDDRGERALVRSEIVEVFDVRLGNSLGIVHDELDPASDMAFSPGSEVLIGTRGGKIRVRTPRAKRPSQLQFGESQEVIEEARFGFQGNWALIGRESSHRLELWDTQSGLCLRRLQDIADFKVAKTMPVLMIQPLNGRVKQWRGAYEGMREFDVCPAGTSVESIDLSGNGEAMLVQTDEGLHHYSFVAGRLEAKPLAWLNEAILSFDGRSVLGLSDQKRLELLDLDRATSREFQHRRRVDGFAMDSSGKRIFTRTAYDNRNFLWTRDGQLTLQRKGPTIEDEFNFIHESRLLVRRGSTYQLLALTELEEILEAKKCSAWSASGDGMRLALGFDDGSISLFRSSDGVETESFLSPSSTRIEAVAFADGDQKILGLDNRGHLRVHGAQRFEADRVSDAIENSTRAVCSLPTGNLLVGLGEDGLSIQSPGSREPVGEIHPRMGTVLDMDVLDHLVLIGCARGMGVWDGSTQTFVRRRLVGSSPRVEFFGNGKFTFGLSDQALELGQLDSEWRAIERDHWFFRSGRVKQAVVARETPSLLIGGHDGSVVVYNVNWDNVVTLRSDPRPLTALAMSRDGEVALVASEDGALRAFDPQNGLLLWEENLDSPVTCLQVSGPTQSIVCGLQDSSVRLLSVWSGKLKKVWLGHGGPLRRAECNEDGSLVVTGALDGSVHLWDLVREEEVYGLSAHRSPIRDLSFSHDGTFVLTTSWDGSFRRWPVNVFEAALDSRARVLSSRERQEFALDPVKPNQEK